MVDIQSNMQQPFSFDNSTLLYDAVRQSLCAFLIDAVDSEIEAVVNLYAEGKKLLEALEDDLNTNEIASIVDHLNTQLFQHALRVNTLKYKI